MTIGQFAVSLLFLFLLLLFSLFGTGALWFQFSSAVGWLFLALFWSICLFILHCHFKNKRPLAWFLLLAVFTVFISWWQNIKPSNDRNWAADVARGVTMEQNGNDIIVHSVRHFDWRSKEDYIPKWETRHYNLDDLTSVDLFSSVWDFPAIAHTMISFGFKNGDHLVFSAEIRRENDEEFSTLGGFFRKFELILIAADERDIIRLRTNIRKEDVSLYPLKMTPEAMRALFTTYLQLGNYLAVHPKFYQTVTANCTTVIYHLAKLIDPEIPADWRILVSGYLIDYLYEQHAVAADIPLDRLKTEAKISTLGRQAGNSDDFSQIIRTYDRKK